MQRAAAWASQHFTPWTDIIFVFYLIILASRKNHLSMSTEVYYGQWRHHYNITASLSKHTHLFDKWTWSWGQVQFKQEKNKLRDEWIHVWTSFTVDHSADPSCGSLQSPDGFWGIKAKYGGETPIIVAVLLQHHYLHIQSSSGQKGIPQRTVPDSLFSDQAFLNHSSTVFGITVVSH